MAFTPGYYISQTPYYGTQPVTAAPSYTPPVFQQQQTMQGMIWVDGEVAAKAFQFPVGWDMTKSLALWDINEPIIYVKSFNQMGMPNPMQKLRYHIEDQQAQMMLPVGQTSGNAEQEAAKMEVSDFVTKDDMEKLKNEIKDMIKETVKESKPATVSNNMQNRGGNK